MTTSAVRGKRTHATAPARFQQHTLRIIRYSLPCYLSLKYPHTSCHTHADRFLSNAHRRSYEVQLTMWKRLIGRRKRCRRLMVTIGGRFCTGNTSTAFRVIRRCNCIMIVCCTLQTCYWEWFNDRGQGVGHPSRHRCFFGRDEKYRLLPGVQRGHPRISKISTWRYK